MRLGQVISPGMPEWYTGTRLLVHWAAIAKFHMVALDFALCVRVCVFVCVRVCWFMHEYRHTNIKKTRMQLIGCSGADELKSGWDVKEIDLQRDLT